MALAVRRLGRVEYEPTAAAMQSFTASRNADTTDELWLAEHPPVYTQGLAGRDEHLGDLGEVPLVRSNRGGQVTYHGPGQVVAYPLVDLLRLGITVKEYVFRLEQAAIRTLEQYGVTGHRVAGAPGVYVRLLDPFGHAPISGLGGFGAVRGATPGRAAATFEGLGKIAALGVKVSRHSTYHGLALNVSMDLSPFRRIDPCGYAGLAVTDLSTIGVHVAVGEVAETLAAKLVAYLDA